MATAAAMVSQPTSGRDRILAAAATRFAELGYAETSLRLIAADVEMKAGSLYYHFGSKDELLVSVLERGIALMIDGFDDVAGTETLTGRELLAAHVRAHLRVLHGNYSFTSLHVTSFRTAPETVRAEIVPQRDAYEAKWTTLLKSILPGRTRREIGTLRLVLFGAMNASTEWFDTGRGNLDEFAEIVTDQFWLGVGRPQTREAS